MLPVAARNVSSRALLPLQEEKKPLSSFTTVSSSSTSLLSPATSPDMSCMHSFSSAEDRIAFDYFLKNALIAIQATAPTQEWIGPAMQHWHIKPVFYAMAAVGSSYRTLSRTIHHTLTRLILLSDVEAAMWRYGKAVSALQEYINDVADNAAAIEPVLISSMMLVSYELMVNGRGTTALSHYQLGRKLSSQKKQMASRKGKPRSSCSPELRDHLHAAFESENLGRGGKLYLNELETFATSSSRYSQSVPSFQPQYHFASPIEADVHLEVVVRRAEAVRNRMVDLALNHVKRIKGRLPSDRTGDFCLANCISRTIDLPKDLQRDLEDIIQAHVSWLAGFRRNHKAREDTASDPISLLTQVRYFASWLIVSTCRETKEILVDRFETEFVRTLDRAEEYLRNVSSEEQPRPTPPPHMREAVGLSFEGGMLPALYLIACKSRSSVIRRRAIEVLTAASRQEGTFHSGVIGYLVGFVVEVEEERAARALQQDTPTFSINNGLASHQLPEEARFSDCVIDSSPGWPPSFKMVFARYLHDWDDKRVEITQYCGQRSPVDLRLESRIVYDCSP